MNKEKENIEELKEEERSPQENKTEKHHENKEHCKHHYHDKNHHEHDCCCNEKHDNKKEEELLAKIKELEELNKSLTDKVKLAQAELVNYRRRKDEETAGMLKYANQNLIMEILPILDNFERAIMLDDNDLTDELSKFLAGFKIMYASLNGALQKFGVEEISRVGEIFDPTQEQALITDSLADHQDEEVLEVLQKGYKLKDRVIRPASVKINQL